MAENPARSLSSAIMDMCGAAAYIHYFLFFTRKDVSFSSLIHQKTGSRLVMLFPISDDRKGYMKNGNDD
jgi:hypothetical protein